MNTQFIFENIIFFPLLAAVVLAVYLIQFCSVISPCRIEFDEDSKREMKLMVRYNKLRSPLRECTLSRDQSGHQ